MGGVVVDQSAKPFGVHECPYEYRLPTTIPMAADTTSAPIVSVRPRAAAAKPANEIERMPAPSMVGSLRAPSFMIVCMSSPFVRPRTWKRLTNNMPFRYQRKGCGVTGDRQLFQQYRSACLAAPASSRNAACHVAPASDHGSGPSMRSIRLSHSFSSRCSMRASSSLLVHRRQRAISGAPSRGTDGARRHPTARARARARGRPCQAAASPFRSLAGP